MATYIVKKVRINYIYDFYIKHRTFSQHINSV